MTNDELRAVLARWAGWIYPGSSCLIYESWDRWIPPKGEKGRKVPNFPKSLDAVATLEARLTHEQRMHYFGELATVTLNSGVYRPEITATAEQRCRALVAALKLTL